MPIRIPARSIILAPERVGYLVLVAQRCRRASALRGPAHGVVCDAVAA